MQLKRLIAIISVLLIFTMGAHAAVEKAYTHSHGQNGHHSHKHDGSHEHHSHDHHHSHHDHHDHDTQHPEEAFIDCCHLQLTRLATATVQSYVFLGINLTKYIIQNFIFSSRQFDSYLENIPRVQSENIISTLQLRLFSLASAQNAPPSIA